MLMLVTPETRYARSGDAHIAHQVMGHAPLDVVLADQWFSLVAGSGIGFEDRGMDALKGVPDEWRIFSVTEA
jgi:hypothetical protein